MTYRKNATFTIRNQDWKFRDGFETLELAALSMLGKKEYGLPTRFTVRLGTKKLDRSRKHILRSIVAGEYKRGTLKIQYSKRKRKWFALIAYEPTKQEEPALDKNRIVGVDIGLVFAVYCSVSDGPQRMSITGGHIERFKRQIKRRRRQIQNQYHISGRKGHGRRRAMLPLETLSTKERNFRDTEYHRISRAVVDWAVRQNAGTIHLEDLSFDNYEKKGPVADWGPYDLIQKIKYKAEETGIEVVLVPPEYTSQRCHVCGNIDKASRKDQATFVCTSCGKKLNADYNAAKNIADANLWQTQKAA
jgi:IS605 OrfB family transposase